MNTSTGDAEAAIRHDTAACADSAKNSDDGIKGKATVLFSSISGNKTNKVGDTNGPPVDTEAHAPNVYTCGLEGTSYTSNAPWFRNISRFWLRL